MNSTTKTVVLIADTHITGSSKRGLHEGYWKKFQEFITEEADEVIHLGDLMDFPQLAGYNSKNLKALSEISLEQDFKRADKFFDELISCFNWQNFLYFSSKSN
jgi:predicted phosphodiesterase